MQLLFQSPELDSYEFVSGELQTQMTYIFDGHINASFFTEEETEQLQNASYLPWHFAKEKIFLLIKGKKTPSHMKLVLRLSHNQTEELLQQNSNYTHHDIDGMFINIYFHEQKLNVILGISYKIFTLGKTFEEDFSKNFITLLKSNQIAFQ